MYCITPAYCHMYVQSLGLQPEEGFILKIVQLQELIDVRHSVFVIGNAGTGKSQVNIFAVCTYMRAILNVNMYHYVCMYSNV